MFLAFFSLGLIIAAIVMIFFPMSRTDEGGEVTPWGPGRYIQGGMVVVGILGLASLSFLWVDADEIGHLKRIYMAKDLPAGRIIAVNPESPEDIIKGPQPEILGPGFHVIPLVRVLYDIEFGKVQTVPDGNYGFLSARDGVPLRDTQFISDPWAEGTETKMLDARHFLSEGKGQKGPQLSVLKPGAYRFNQYLFSMDIRKALDVPTGHVAVIRSNVTTRGECPNAALTTGHANAEVALPIVPKGCVGVWDEPLPPGRYYLNDKAYVPTIIPTRLINWSYKGGYKKRTINLTVEDNGSIKQNESSEDVEFDPKKHADKAIFVRVEGWTFPVEMRIVVQVHPKDAPKVVAAVGDLNKVEDTIITPAIRDILRTIGGRKGSKCRMEVTKTKGKDGKPVETQKEVCEIPGTRVLDFVENRDKIIAEVEKAIIYEAKKVGVTVQEARMGEPSLPPELLVAPLREQLATQLKETYMKEEAAQKQRIAVERERATANQQETLVTAEIKEKAAEHTKNEMQKLGEGEKLKLMEMAKGQAAQVKVLGADRTMQIQMLEKALEAAKENPDIVKVPVVNVSGGGTSLEGAAAVLGASTNLTRMMDSANAATVKPKK